MNKQVMNQEKKTYVPAEIQVIRCADDDVIATSLMVYNPFYGEDDEFVHPTASGDTPKNA